MIDYSDPDLVFVKGKNQKQATYFQVLKKQNESVTLIDIANNATFKFDDNSIQEFFRKGVLSVTTVDKVSHIEKLQFKKEFPRRKPKIASDNTQKKKTIERKMSYITYINSLNLKALTEKHLAPELKKHAEEINDPSPPSWRTYTRWIKAYVESGWDEDALYKYDNCGNRDSRLDPEVIQVLSEVKKMVTDSPRRLKFKDINQNIIEMVEDKNEDRLKVGKPPLQIPSYSTIQRWLTEL